MLEEFGRGIWLAEGPAVAVFGFRYPTRMAVIRLSDGGLLVWSPVALTDALADAVSALGPVAWLVAPNHLHHLFLPDWISAFPEARLAAAPGLATKRPELRIDVELGSAAPTEWHGDLDQARVEGNAITTEIVFFHRASGTVLICDLLQQFDEDWFHGWRRVIAQLDRMTAPTPSMPRKFRMAFTRKAAARPALRQILDWPAERLVVAHGAPVTRDASTILHRAFAGLAG